MGYFSNGTEGMDYQAQYCERCIHDVNQDCPVWLIHLMHNYDQFKDENIEAILCSLIPRKPDTFNDQCKMFVEKPK